MQQDHISSSGEASPHSMSPMPIHARGVRLREPAHKICWPHSSGVPPQSTVMLCMHRRAQQWDLLGGAGYAMFTSDQPCQVLIPSEIEAV